MSAVHLHPDAATDTDSASQPPTSLQSPPRTKKDLTSPARTPKPVLPSALAQGWQESIISLCRALIVLLSSEEKNTLKIKQVQSELEQIYTEANNQRNDYQSNPIILFIHNLKNKLPKAKELIAKELWEKAIALISSVLFEQELMMPGNRTLGFMLQTFIDTSRALSTASMSIHIATEDEKVKEITSSNAEALIAIQTLTENLLMNAIKYTGHKGDITLSVTREDQSLTIAVTDRAPESSIPTDLLEKINRFEPSIDSSDDEVATVDATASWRVGLPDSMEKLRASFGNDTILKVTVGTDTKSLSFTVPLSGQNIDFSRSYQVPSSMSMRSPSASTALCSASSPCGGAGSGDGALTDPGIDAMLTPKPPTTLLPRAFDKGRYVFVLIEDDAGAQKLTQRTLTRSLTEVKKIYPEFNCEYHPFTRFCDFFSELEASVDPTAPKPLLRNAERFLIGVDSTTAGDSHNGTQFLEWMNEPAQEWLLDRSQLAWYSERFTGNPTFDAAVTATRCVVSDNKQDAFTVSKMKIFLDNLRTGVGFGDPEPVTEMAGPSPLTSPLTPPVLRPQPTPSSPSSAAMVMMPAMMLSSTAGGPPPASSPGAGHRRSSFSKKLSFSDHSV